MKITELTQDMAGKWRARVDFGSFSQYFKFQKNPTDQEILDEAQRFSNNIIIQLNEDAVNKEEKQNIIQKIQGYDSTTITKTQATNALDIIIPFLIKHYGDTN